LGDPKSNLNTIYYW